MKSWRLLLSVLATIPCFSTSGVAQSQPVGAIDAATLVSAPLGNFGGVDYTRYEAMFAGTTSNNRPFRVPCQFIAPTTPGTGSGTLLFDWLVVSTAATAVGQEQADARYGMSDAFLFGLGLSYATVRCDVTCIGRQSPIPDSTRPWSDGLLDKSSEFITSRGDEYDIVVSYVRALRTDPVAAPLLGPITRRTAFGYSAAGSRLRGLLRLQAGVGLFDFTLVGGAGIGVDHPAGNGVGYRNVEREPLAGAGLEIDVQTETEVVASGASKARHQEPNYRSYEIAGASHIRAIDCAEFGLVDPAGANPAEWTPFLRAMFVAGLRWCDGVSPPATLWLGAPNDAKIQRDANGNALVTHVGGVALATSGFLRLPEVAVGENRYIPYAPQFNDGSFLGLFRSIGGSHVDLTDSITSHATYVAQITQHALAMQAGRYLLPADAAAIIQRAIQSNIGN